MRRSRCPRRRRIALAFLLVPPMAWLVLAYLGSLAVLLVSAFWSTNSFTGAVVHKFTTHNIVAGVHRFGVPGHHAAHDRRGPAGHRDLHRARGAIGVVHGQGGLAADAAAAGDRGDDPAVGQLSGQGVRVADAALAGGPAGLGGRLHAGLRPYGHRHHPDLPVVAVHDHPGVRGVRPGARLADRRQLGPRRIRLSRRCGW